MRKPRPLTRLLQLDDYVQARAARPENAEQNHRPPFTLTSYLEIAVMRALDFTNITHVFNDELASLTGEN